MIVLHAIWDNIGKFQLWAESSHPPAFVSKRRGKQPKGSKPQLHPFALAQSSLKEIVSKLSPNLIDEGVDFEVLPILLPFSQSGPLPSPELILEEALSDKNATGLTTWDVNTLNLNPYFALDFLLSLPNQPPSGVAFGSSLRFWIEVAKFSLELITRQRFIPTLHEDKRDNNRFFRACWEVILAEEDNERMHLLSEAMPPCCRAFISPKGKKPLPPRELLLSFLNQTMDAFIRKNLSLTPLSKEATLPEKWLEALSSDDSIIKASVEEIAGFSRALKSWLNEIQPIAPDASFRTCFKLDPPADDNKEWKASFHLQARDDRSLLVPAEKVWGTKSKVITFLKRKFENPQERLLADLGKASRVFPAIEEGLKMARPVELNLDTGQAYEFLRHSAPLLEQSGFGVFLPPWWQKPAVTLSAKLKVKPKGEAKAVGSGIFGMDSIVAYNWEISLGEEKLSAEEFMKLASLKVPLVQIRGQWVELKPEEIEKALSFFQKKQGNGEMKLGEALRLGLGQEVSEVGLPITGIESEGWIDKFINKLSEGVKLAEVEIPQGFNGKLRPYQVKGLSWLAFLNQFGLGACLADDMGLGKTIQLIALLLYERLNKTGKLKLSPTLLICPLSVAGNWRKEVERFAPSLKVVVHHGPERLSDKSFKAEVKKHDLVISTYALAYRDEKALSTIHWERVVLDEAQNIKNPSAKQTQAIRDLKANHKVALTGTPVENRLSELWSIMEFLNPGYLKSAKDFRQNFVIPIEKFRNPGRAETLRRLIQPFVLRRVKTDPAVIKDLPEKIEMKDFCHLKQEQATLYEAVVKEMLEEIEHSEGIKRKGLILSTLMKLKQICNHPALFMQDRSPLPGRSGKLARLVEMLEEILAEGDKALIFTQFAEMGGMLQHHLQETLGCETLFLHGSTPKKKREAMVERFQDERHGPSLFVLSLKAGGFGLNLTGANHVFHFDRWWNPAVENQATDRTFRIGQKRNVQIHKFVCVGTLEERIDQMIEQKKELAESIIGSGEAWLTEMSTDELKKIFALSRSGVEEG